MARIYFALILATELILTSVPGHAFVAPLSQPSWTELNAEQQQVLAPLSKDWDEMDAFHRKKWLGIARRYPLMTEEERTRTQHRMTAWAKLTPEERKLARTKYKTLQKTSPGKKEAVKQKWREYQNLPESEKTRLKSEAAHQTKFGLRHSKSFLSKEPVPRPPPRPAIGGTDPERINP